VNRVVHAITSVSLSTDQTAYSVSMRQNETSIIRSDSSMQILFFYNFSFSPFDRVVFSNFFDCIECSVRLEGANLFIDVQKLRRRARFLSRLKRSSFDVGSRLSHKASYWRWSDELAARYRGRRVHTDRSRCSRGTLTRCRRSGHRSYRR